MNEVVVTKEISKRVQGIAILMMIIHHTFGFPERILPGVTYIGLTIGSLSVENFIGQMCKICVTLFAFGTGYGLAFKKINWPYILQKTITLLKLYWFLLILFLIAKIIGGGSSALKDILENACLYKTDISHAAWYLSFYVMALLTLWLTQKIKLKAPMVILFCMICWAFNFGFNTLGFSIWSGAVNYFIYIPVVIIGKYFAMNNYIQNALCSLSKNLLGLLVSILVLIITLGMRVLTGAEMKGFRFIWIYAPFIYLSFALILFHCKKVLIINRILDFLGEFSTEFWLINAIFTSEVFWIQWLCFLPKVSILVVTWEFLLMFIIALLYRAANNFAMGYTKPNPKK